MPKSLALRGSSVAIAGGLVLLVAGCGGGSGAAASGSASASGSSPTGSPTSTGSAAASCLVGTWQVDGSALASQVGQLVKGATASATAGSSALVFSATQLKVAFGSVLTVSKPVPGKPPVVSSVSLRGASQANYVANDSTFRTSGTNGVVRATESTTSAGKTTEVDVTKLYSPLLTFTTGTVAYSCNPASLRLSNMDGFSVSASRKTP